MITQKFANEVMYSDIHPCEIIKVVSEKTIEIRPMKCESLPWEKEFHPGGFCGHFTNQRDQKWKITSDENAEIFRIRLNKKGWKSATGVTFVLAEDPCKFHDYNF